VTANGRLGINLIGLTDGRLSGVGQYSVRLFETLIDLIREGITDVVLVGFIVPEARAHFSARAQPHLVDVRPKAGRVGRVLFDHTVFPFIIRRSRLDVLINPAFTGPLWGAKRHVPVIHDLYFKVVPELLESRQQKYLSALVPINLKLAWRVISDSRSSAGDIARFYPFAARKTRVVHLAGRFEDAVGLGLQTRSSSPYALIVSSMTANKNPATAIAAVAYVRGQGHDFQLKHIGADPIGLWERSVREAGAGYFCQALGSVDDERLLLEMAGATCLIAPSFYEGFGLPVLEGQQLGVPVLASNTSSLPEVGGQGALYFDPADSFGCAEHIIRLLLNPDLRGTLISKGYENAAQFTWRATAVETLRHLDLI
jgi:glycosyltransferase involved in cell wall biosynthesis